ncbi:competence protein ComGF [Staphylococcus simiae]|uniref:competence type IV pilus minor pilin ComGF n=1 Tax=Staphylococcus simiae TaxID=308354 RepID=UPI001A96F6A8|nr:competence type IV pilus minor pilin ComGF [Staphylococcus simiae]MBO1197935.1 competence protein ComGF [Staphylococcus simiae]MBO1200412.1 competence protein ComGF [Staphylococcus simiae]MBO1202685.1 competence protein ComGF [Staphylococcus simiae]MBO1209926.1 competence protein ComGF [Staphylococcus simiae]MBO1228829.1 competence protein ComGF [Staphylococcus simiae]
MVIIILILQFIPQLLIYSQYIKEQAKETYTIDYEFFSRDFIKELKDIDHKHISISNNSIYVNNGKDNIEYKLLNHKIIKIINHNGNITLLNNVEKFKATVLNKNVIKIDIEINRGRYFKNQTIYL